MPPGMGRQEQQVSGKGSRACQFRKEEELGFPHVNDSGNGGRSGTRAEVRGEAQVRGYAVRLGSYKQ